MDANEARNATPDPLADALAEVARLRAALARFKVAHDEYMADESDDYYTFNEWCAEHFPDLFDAVTRAADALDTASADAGEGERG